MSTVAVDFDGVIHAYSQGWKDGSIYDPPLPGAEDGLRELMQYYAVFIHTTREPNEVASWISRRLNINSITLSEGQLPQFWNNRNCLLVTSRKLPAIAYIDDRGVRFSSWSQALDDLYLLAGDPRESRGD